MSHEVALLDVNVLYAISEPAQVHHSVAMKWFSRLNQPWAICGITEAGFLRIATNPRVGAHSIAQATAFLTRLTSHPGFVFWPISESWVQLARPLSPRIHGHQQVRDAYLLGLAIANRGTLVTLDRAMLSLAGPEFRDHVLLLG